MKRVGRVLKLKRGKEREYLKMHQSVWPEVLKTIKKSKIKNYSIFIYKRWLFSYFEYPESVTSDYMDNIFKTSNACKKWEKLMKKYQEPLPESSTESLSLWVPMREIWRFDNKDNLC